MKTVFMFSGLGSHHFQMGREMFEKNDTFRQWMLRLDALAQESLRRSVIETIYSSRKADVFDRTLLTHHAIFMVAYSLAQCLMHEGVMPDMTLGASLGSLAAATIAGFMDVKEAVTAVIEQATTFEACCGRGGMIAVLADPALFAEGFLSGHSELAGVTSHRISWSPPDSRVSPGSKPACVSATSSISAWPFPLLFTRGGSTRRGRPSHEWSRMEPRIDTSTWAPPARWRPA